MQIIEALALLVAANASPLLVAKLLDPHFRTPIDAKLIFRDGKPLLGQSKTWRGLIAAILGTTLMAFVLGYTWWIGSLVGALAMLGDSCSSFTKRRLGYVCSHPVYGLDEIPEALFPTLALSFYLELNVLQLIIIVALFVTLSFCMMPLLLFLGLKKTSD